MVTENHAGDLVLLVFDYIFDDAAMAKQMSATAVNFTSSNFLNIHFEPALRAVRVRIVAALRVMVLDVCAVTSLVPRASLISRLVTRSTGVTALNRPVTWIAAT